ncbi:unnamed protein product, partial [Hapterophycus canaliculatus]
LRVVSLATGNKCVGNGQIPDDGSVVHDSHAEVLARRALLLRLWKELRLRAPGDGGGGGGWRLKTHLRLHLYISDAPCGDASIY